MQNQSIVKNHQQDKQVYRDHRGTHDLTGHQGYGLRNSNSRSNHISNDQRLTILYSRLSVEDSNDKESNSITTQRTILENYAKQHNLHPFVHIVDDGFSGASWQRPGWQEVMSKVGEGSAKAVVVKNLDLMGRDHLRVVAMMIESSFFKGNFWALLAPVASFNSRQQ